MHGTIMLLFFATPILFAFANYIVPLQIGAPDVSFPRLNALRLLAVRVRRHARRRRLPHPGRRGRLRLVRLPPLTNVTNSPGAGADMWIVGLVISGLGTILGAVNMITTILTLRAPGMTMFRMPIFTWNIMVTSLLVLMVFPILAAALLALAADRHLGRPRLRRRPPAAPLLWQHLFWFFGHPEVYIVALPFFGIISEIIPVFSRKPIFGYKGLVAATIGIAALSMSVWAHHMFATGQVLLPFFSFLSLPHRGTDRHEVLQLDRHHVAGPDHVRDADAVRHRLPGHVPVRWPVRRAAGQPADRLPRLRHVLRGGALPLRAVRHDRVRGLRRGLLLVPEDDRPDDGRALGQGPLLADHHRLQHHVPGAALARRRGHAPPVLRLPAPTA